jgi:preprotein translocase subunit SecG
MMTFLITLHAIICVLLIVTVLLQFGKGAEAGAIMGGGAGASQAVFSSSAKGNFMTKITTFLAVAFMVNSIFLTVIKSREAKRSLFDNEAPVAAPLNSDTDVIEPKDRTVPSKPAAPAPEARTAEPTAPVPATKPSPTQAPN